MFYKMNSPVNDMMIYLFSLQVVSTKETSDATFKELFSFGQAMGKTCVKAKVRYLLSLETGKFCVSVKVGYFLSF